MPYAYVSVEGPVVAARPIDRNRDLEPLARRSVGTEVGKVGERWEANPLTFIRQASAQAIA